MTPREKAIEIVNKLIFIPNGERFQIISMKDEKRAIQCGLILVDEVLLETPMRNEFYWKEVKKEMELL